MVPPLVDAGPNSDSDSESNASQHSSSTQIRQQLNPLASVPVITKSIITTDQYGITSTKILGSSLQRKNYLLIIKSHESSHRNRQNNARLVPSLARSSWLLSS